MIFLVDEKKAEEVDDFSVQLTFQCRECKEFFELELDEDDWGSSSIDVNVKTSEYKK